MTRPKIPQPIIPIERAISQRAQAVTPGERGQLLDMAAEFQDVITLARGDPDFTTPLHIIEAAKQALDNGYTHYTHWAGIPELRQAIADKLERDNDVIVDPDTEILVTTGAQEAVFLTCMALLNPGDEILVPTPHYMTYDTAFSLAEARPVLVPTYESDDFEVQPEEIAKRITPRTKAILLVSPNNPTGGTIEPETIHRITALAEEHDLILISDEIYEKIIFDDIELLSPASLPGVRERTVTINGFSKTYAMTGWRVGYLAAPAGFIRALEALKHTVSICASAVSQAAALAALTGPQDCVHEMVATYARRRRVLMRGLDAVGLSYGQPNGTFYVFANVTSANRSSLDFAIEILQRARILVLPGSAFGTHGEGFVRFSLVAPEAQLEEAVVRMKDALLN